MSFCFYYSVAYCVNVSFQSQYAETLLYFAKIVKVERRKTSLLDFYAETHPILYKDSESRTQNNKFTLFLC